MDFSFSEEQTLLRNTIQSFIQDNYDFDKRREIIQSEEGMSKDNWKQLAELGLLGVPFSENDGGLEFSSVETMIVAEEFGKGLVVEPYIQTVVTCGGFLRRASEAQRQEHLPRLISGDEIWAFAYAEPQGRFNLADIKVSASKNGDDYTLNGDKCVVSGAPWAQKLIVSARTSGDQERLSSNRWFRVILAEGKTREVRRLWESQGVEVNRLKRISYGPIQLPSFVRSSEFIELDPKQVASLFNEVSLRLPQFSERNVLKDIRERKERKLRARGSSYR